MSFSPPSNVPRLLAGGRALARPLLSLINVFKSCCPVQFAVSHIKLFSFLAKAKYSSTMTGKFAAAQALQLEQAERLLKSAQKKSHQFYFEGFFFFFLPPVLFYSPNNKLTLNFPQAAVPGDISPCPQMFLLIKSDILCGAINHYLLLFFASRSETAEKSNQALFPGPKFPTKSTSAVSLWEKNKGNN